MSDFLVYYGHDYDLLPQLGQAKTLVIEPAGWSDEALTWLRQAVPRVLGYLSVCQWPGWKGEPPAEFQAGDFDHEWSSWWMDPSQPAWATHLQNRAQTIAAQCHGLFLDNLDRLDARPEIKPGLLDLLGQLRQSSPSAYLLGNRGFSASRELSALLDGVMFENACDRNFSSNDQNWVRQTAQLLRELKYEVFVLNYKTRLCSRQSDLLKRRFPDFVYWDAPDEALQSLV